jgi:hypothetical protein
MTTLNSTIKISVGGTLAGTAGLVSLTAPLNQILTEEISSTQGTTLYTDSVTSDTANKTYDLIGASALLDPFGVAVDIDQIAAIVIENTHATAYLHVTGLPAAMLKSGAAVTLILPPGGMVALAVGTGWASTTDIVITGRNAGDSGNVSGTWKLVVIGKHA